MELGPLGEPEPVGLELRQCLVEADRLIALALEPEVAELAAAEFELAVERYLGNKPLPTRQFFLRIPVAFVATQ